MALPAPIEIPQLVGFNSKVFELGFYQQVSPGSRGFIQTIERGAPGWLAEYKTPPLRADRYDATVEFLLRLEGSLQTFLAWDPRRIMPRAYQDLTTAQDPWTQSGETAPRVLASSYVNGTLNLDRLANGAIITAGDYISFKIGFIWYLFRVVATVIAAGNAAIVQVRPRPDLTGTLPVNIRYRKACCAMKIMGRIEEEDTVDSLPTFSFKAAQFFDRSTS